MGNVSGTTAARISITEIITIFYLGYLTFVYFEIIYCIMTYIFCTFDIYYYSTCRNSAFLKAHTLPNQCREKYVT